VPTRHAACHVKRGGHAHARQRARVRGRTGAEEAAVRGEVQGEHEALDEKRIRGHKVGRAQRVAGRRAQQQQRGGRHEGGDVEQKVEERRVSCVGEQRVQR
jgi:hypothetical protein